MPGPHPGATGPSIESRSMIRSGDFFLIDFANPKRVYSSRPLCGSDTSCIFRTESHDREFHAPQHRAARRVAAPPPRDRACRRAAGVIARIARNRLRARSRAAPGRRRTPRGAARVPSGARGVRSAPCRSRFDAAPVLIGARARLRRPVPRLRREARAGSWDPARASRFCAVRASGATSVRSAGRAGGEQDRVERDDRDQDEQGEHPRPAEEPPHEAVEPTGVARIVGRFETPAAPEAP